MSLIEGQLEVDRAVPFIALGGVICRSIREGKEPSGKGGQCHNSSINFGCYAAVASWSKREDLGKFGLQPQDVILNTCKMPEFKFSTSSPISYWKTENY